MVRMRRKGIETTGFIDPHVVYKPPARHMWKNWLRTTQSNLLIYFENHRNKRRVLFPYNFG